jgi:hypothetical protein
MKSSKRAKKKREPTVGGTKVKEVAEMTPEERQQQQDNFELYSPNLLVWMKNPYKKKTRIADDDIRIGQGLPPYDADTSYRAEFLSERRSMRPVWVRGRVVSIDQATMSLTVATAQCFPLKTTTITVGCTFPSTPYIVNDQSDFPSTDGVDDMVNMAQLHDASLLHNIEKRFHRRQIYTYAGDTLIAVNPYVLIPLSSPYWAPIGEKCSMRLALAGLSASGVDIYHPAVQQEYIKCPSPSALEDLPAEKRKHYEMPPHAFEVAHRTFHALNELTGDAAPRAQCVVISGNPALERRRRRS